MLSLPRNLRVMNWAVRLFSRRYFGLNTFVQSVWFVFFCMCVCLCHYFFFGVSFNSPKLSFDSLTFFFVVQFRCLILFVCSDCMRERLWHTHTNTITNTNTNDFYFGWNVTVYALQKTLYHVYIPLLHMYISTYTLARSQIGRHVCWWDFTAGWNSILAFHLCRCDIIHKKNPRIEKEPKRKQQHEMNCIWNLLYEKITTFFCLFSLLFLATSVVLYLNLFGRHVNLQRQAQNWIF